MRKLIQSSTVLLALTLAAATASHAQTSQDPPQGQAPHHQFHRGGPNPEFETRMLTKRLGLSETQASQVEPILAAQDQALKALRPAQGTQPDFKAMHEQTKTIFENTKTQLSTVLSAEQLQKFEAMRRHRGPGGPHGNWKGQQSGTAAPSL